MRIKAEIHLLKNKTLLKSKKKYQWCKKISIKRKNSLKKSMFSVRKEMKERRLNMLKKGVKKRNPKMKRTN